jgi:serine acetyltransferase
LIGHWAEVLKNACVLSDRVIGAFSLVNKSIFEINVIAAKIPAKNN